MATTMAPGLSKKGLNGMFFPQLEKAAALWKMICSSVDSTSSSEDYGWMGQVPTVTEWRGERRTQAQREFEWAIKNKDWEATLKIARNAIADAQTGHLKVQVPEMAKRFAKHPDKLLFDLIVAGETTPCYDGQYFFDTDHVEGDSGSQSNDLTFDVAVPTAPTEAEFEKAFYAAVTAMMGFKDDQGEPWNDFADLDQLDGILCAVPLPFLRVASKVLGIGAAPVIDGTTNVLAGRSKMIACARLNWTNKFVIMKIDDPMRPFIFQNREKVQTSIDDDPKIKDILYMANGRYNLGYAFWAKAVLMTLT